MDVKPLTPAQQRIVDQLAAGTHALFHSQPKTVRARGGIEVRVTWTLTLTGTRTSVPVNRNSAEVLKVLGLIEPLQPERAAGYRFTRYPFGLTDAGRAAATPR